MSRVATDPSRQPGFGPLRLASLSNPPPNDLLASLLALSIGMAITLCVYGYQFGRSNHTIYLLAALHESNPPVLARDWFTTQTLQYHAAFTWLTRALIALHALETGFLTGYLTLVLILHVAWLRLTLL